MHGLKQRQNVKVVKNCGFRVQIETECEVKSVFGSLWDNS